MAAPFLEPELARLIHEERLADATARHRLAMLSETAPPARHWRWWAALRRRWSRGPAQPEIFASCACPGADGCRAVTAPDRA